MIRYFDGNEYRDAETPEQVADAVRWILTRNEGASAVRWTMRAIREANAAAGMYFFEPSTMRFFNSRVMGGRAYQGPGGVYFTTSEKGPSGPRLYSVRRFDPATADIDTAGTFQAYKTTGAAHRAAKRLAALVAVCA